MTNLIDVIKCFFMHDLVNAPDYLMIKTENDETFEELLLHVYTKTGKKLNKTVLKELSFKRLLECYDEDEIIECYDYFKQFG